MDDGQVSTKFYNTDCGTKQSMARALQGNPNRMSIMKSGTRRFQSQPGHLVTPFAVYKLDTAHKKGVSSSVRDSKRFYAAPFYARTRSTSPCSSSQAGLGCSYDVQALTSGQAPTFQVSVEQSPIRYTVMKYAPYLSRPRAKPCLELQRRFNKLSQFTWSKLARVTKAVATAAPDIVYDTDRMEKQCLVSKVDSSPILYANMSRSKVQRTGMVSSSCSPAEIGPGAYDCPIRSDVRTSLVLNQNPLSSLLSRAPRLATDKVDPTKNLGSTWKQETDNKYWRRGQTIAKAHRRL